MRYRNSYYYHNDAEKPLGRSFDETASNHWTLDIQKMLEHERFDHTPVSIHKVRHAIRAIKPEAYTPQYIGLGPYHHWREELEGVDAYKLHASKYFCPSHENAYEKLDELAKSFEKEHVPRVRASYDRYLTEDDRSLAWLMVIDGIFLLLFLQEHVDPKSCKALMMTRTNHLVDRTESAYYSILQDIIMFENQIPLFGLDEQLIRYCDLGDGNHLFDMLLKTCKFLCPLNCKHNEPDLRRKGIKHYAHLLEFLYCLIVPKAEPTNSSHEVCFGKDDTTTQPTENKTRHKGLRNGCQKFIRAVPAIKFEMLLTSTKSILPARAVAKIKQLKLISSLVTYFCSIFSSMNQQGGSSGTPNASNGSGGSSNSSESNEKEAMKVEEIDIPSVSKLLKVGIDLQPMPNGCPITDIEFDNTSQQLFLPKITIDANTEVVIRNLVAYEAEAISGPLVLARYTELMNGIIGTATDVMLLRKKKILVNHLKTDEEVAQLWNGMSRSIRKSKVQSMDWAIQEVNNCYKRKIRVRFIRFTRECLFCGWKILMLLLALALMVFWTIQSFCYIYNCPRALEPVTAPPAP